MHHYAQEQDPICFGFRMRVHASLCQRARSYIVWFRNESPCTHHYVKEQDPICFGLEMRVYASLCQRAGSYMLWFWNKSPCIIMSKSKILYALV